MKPIRLILVIVTLFSSVWHAEAQLHIYKTDFTPDTVPLGTIFTFDAFIRNTNGGTTYVAPLRLAYSINGAVQQIDSSSGLAFDTSGTTVILPPGDSAAKSIFVNVNLPRFQVGPSVVVIWPISSGMWVGDSLILNILVTPPSTIPVLDENELQAYISNGNLVLKADSSIYLKRVRIFDILGREMSEQQEPEREIPLPVLMRGIYVAEITYDRDKRKTFRFYR